MSLRRHKASRFARIRKHRICNVFKQCVCPALKFQGKPLSRSSYISFTCHMTICTCTTACSKQTSAALSAASKKTTSRRCASSAGYRWYTYWHFKEPTVSEKTTTTIKVCYKGPASALISGSGCILYFLQIFKYRACSCPTYLAIKLSISSLGEVRNSKSMANAYISRH